MVSPAIQLIPAEVAVGNCRLAMMVSMLRIPINTKSKKYEAIIEPGALARAGEILQQTVDGKPTVFVVTVSPVRRRWGKVLSRSLESAGFLPRFVEMRDGK